MLDGLWPDGEVVVAGERLPIRALTQADDFSGEHVPTGIFLAAGPHVRRGGPRIALSVLDLSALVFYLSGLPVPDDLDGALPHAVIDPAWLAAEPPRSVAAADLPVLGAPVAAPGEPASDEDVTERLRSLGYVE